MEKRKPTFDLSTIQSEMCSVETLQITQTALNCAAELDIEPEGIVAIIASIQRTHFFKSMTTYHDHTRWQDVYYVPYETIELYVKFSIDDDGHIVVSFKERG